MDGFKGCSISGSVSNLEIPLPLTSICLLCEAKSRIPRLLGLSLGLAPNDLCRGHSQVGSLAGAAHLLNDNTGVLR